ncbi:MAG: hypothetical protein Ct9H90mP13_03190 [Pseudomonadota bacterium]|nr:MAG: hypothetical protein Ct9H90mP13_03190 [Pseudomonadota bacterium]
MTNINPQEVFTKPILDWWDKSGRKDLPWQKETSLYKTWVSEIMLQQTQVKTVIPYFLKFISEYPSINELASSDESEVMALWSGLVTTQEQEIFKRCENHKKRLFRTFS